jgi:alcohol dehydrogenase class IV
MVSFTFSKIPHLYFGPGRFKSLARIAAGFGNRAVVVTGGSSLRSGGNLDILTKGLKDASVSYRLCAITGEPSPEAIDEAVGEFAVEGADVVIAVGGGSVVDAGKAISAMLPFGESVGDYLEGMGKKTHTGQKVPFIAVPTTAGTGSEATKNAVLSRRGKEGFKRSVRHDNFVPDVAIVDPELTLSCPFDVTAACAMDAFTQLLESYVSVLASPMTDALALPAIEMAAGSLIDACRDGANLNARAMIAYASFISGVTLAQAGLGVVHGFASVLGGYYDIPHGVVCATLLGAATRANIEGLKRAGDEEGLLKFARVGAFFTIATDRASRLVALTDTLDAWTNDLQLPGLGRYGIKEADVERLSAQTGVKENPVQLSRQELADILLTRL